MKNFTKKTMLFSSIIFGCLTQTLAQSNAQNFTPDGDKEYVIKGINADAGKILTYGGTNGDVKFLTSVDNFNQAWRFIAVEGDGNSVTTEYYVVSSKIATDGISDIAANVEHVTDKGKSIIENSPTWHVIRIFKDDNNQFAIKFVGSGATTGGQNRGTWYINGQNLKYNSGSTYNVEPPTTDYNFLIEETTPTIDDKDLLNITKKHAEDVMTEVTKQKAEGFTVFGTGGRYQDESVYIALQNKVTEVISANPNSYHSIWISKQQLEASLNNLFATPTINPGDYYLRNGDNSANVFGRINNNKGSYLRNSFNYNINDKDNQVFTFIQSRQNGPVLVQYKDAAEGNSRYWTKSTNGSTTPNAVDSVVFYYDISTGKYAMQFIDNGGFVRMNGIETRNSNLNVVAAEFFITSIVPEQIQDNLITLQAAITAAEAMYNALDVNYTYNPEIAVDFSSKLAESKNILQYKYDASISSIITKRDELQLVSKAYPNGRMFEIDTKVNADKWVGLASGNGKLNAASESTPAYWGNTNGSSSFIIGSYDFGQNVDTITIEYATKDNNSNYTIEIYVTDPNDANNKIASYQIAQTSDWTTPVALSTSHISNLPTTGIHEVYIKYVNTVANIFSVGFYKKNGTVSIANEQATSALKYYIKDKTIYVDLDKKANVKLISATGQLIDQSITSRQYEQTVNQDGVYILNIDGKSFKVVIK